MRVQDDGRGRGGTHETEADPRGERKASTVRYVPIMTSEQLAAYQTELRSAQTGAADRDSWRSGTGGADTGRGAQRVCSNRSVSRGRPTVAA